MLAQYGLGRGEKERMLVKLHAHREGHPAVDYLLLLASLDDGFGILIMSVFYRARPQKLEWLSLLLLAMLLVSTRVHTLHTRTYTNPHTHTHTHVYVIHAHTTRARTPRQFTYIHTHTRK
jgi:hypothetical protein